MQHLNIQFSNEGQILPEKINVSLERRDTIIVIDDNRESEILNFSGIIQQGNNIFVSLPKNYITNKMTLLEDIQLLFKTIMKHHQNNQELYFTKSANLKTNYPFNAFFDIYNYYQKFGIYHEEIIETKEGYSGNVSWKETLNKSTKVVSKKGILFLPLRIKKSNQKEVFISECMAYAIDYTIKQFSIFLNIPIVGGQSLKKNLINNKTYIIRELYNLKREIFKDVHKKLLEDLIIFFENIPSGGTYYLKHYTFSTIWENIVEKYLNYHFVKIVSNKLIFDDEKKMRNTFKKTIFYPNAANETQNIQPDHYFTKDKEQFIFDAKYYKNINGIDYKQLAYYFLLDKISDETHRKKYKITHNALILPGNKEQKVHFIFKPEFNRDESSFIIYEYYLDVKKGMNVYINE